MKPIQMRALFVLLICCLVSSQLQAQYKTIIDRLKADIPGEGRVSITADEKILALTGKCMAADDTYLKLNGFRINVYSGNGRNAKEMAENRARVIREKFPEIMPYVIYNAPFFRLRIGDFQYEEGATLFLHQLRKEFPQFAGEMLIVSDEIKVSIID